MSGREASGTARLLAALAGAGFRRYSTYRQATVAGAFTNVIFGFMHCYVVRSGDVVSDLLRPVDLMATYLATDVGRAGFAMLTRFVAPVGVGMLAFDLYLPANPATYALFAVSVTLAVVICSACRFLVGLTAFWLLDVRGMNMMWVFLSGAASGLYFPLPFLPDWLVTLLWVATPFPSLMQAPLDVLVERGSAVALVAGQTAWLVVAVGVSPRRAAARVAAAGDPGWLVRTGACWSRRFVVRRSTGCRSPWSCCSRRC